MNIIPYERKVNYYETDRMQIVHHTNYVRYFEEARIHFMDQIGTNVQALEDMGLIIPNTDAYAAFIKPLKFDDKFTVTIKSFKFTGAKMKFEYVITINDTDEVAAKGYTTHCIVNDAFKPINIKRSHPDIFRLLSDTSNLYDN